ncbi:DNA translocase FtsK [Porphyromonas sp.]|uniref:FtsK/SpoIIIE family DNA translocase n=1 Tax=Porphyromonas sp. TaxID=1924944 RepID=UPI0026DB4D6E|nr:DNA translocase FtsK [Porphyromonas sp.]MDO4695152.1 DNA translocase FtsK 4TM domain-containing protein [Porphyromonas sp.]MDO4770204.1 DNA translocase FtsK 4TM domain-containing protein [Porphyromonas sp.]
MRKNSRTNRHSNSQSKPINIKNFTRQIFSGETLKDNIAPIIGILLLAISIFSIYSYITYIFTGSDDQSIMTSKTIEMQEAVSSTSNPSGFRGAYLMHTLVNGWVGLSVIIAFIYMLYLGLSILRRNGMKRIKMFIFSSIAIFWTSLFLTTILEPWNESLFFRPGGIVGEELHKYLHGQIGYFGIILVLITALLITLFIFFKSVKERYKTWVTSQNDRRGTTLSTEGLDTQISQPKWWQKLLIKKKNKEVNEIPTKPEENTSDPEIFDIEDTSDDTVAQDTIEWSDVAQDEEIPHTTRSEDGELDIEIIDARKEDPELPIETSPEDKARQLVQEFGEYDPRLDLGQYKMPTLDLLDDRAMGDISIDHEEVQKNKESITETLKNFGIGITSIRATVGPTITLYEVVPESGVKISRIRNLEDDIALSLSALGIRIIAPMPGKGTVGLEVPNKNAQVVGMRSVIASKKFQEAKYELPVALGRTITNEVFTFDLAKVPHLLVAGATGQGKSVGLNAVITSLLYRKHPAELKFVMIDPKMVEFSVYSAIEKHYMAKLADEKDCIITDTKRVVTTLNSLCKEMDDRYELLTKAKVRNLKEYNELFKSRRLNPANGHRFMPYIVVIIDEYGDLIMTAGKEIELPIARLAQKARAVGIHAIIATQRPTASIITGTIKANFPGRISFRVFSMIDSRTILDSPGANRLVGKGDLLYSQGNEFIRVQCAFVDTPEVNRIVDYISAQRGFSHAYELPEVSSGDGGMGDIPGMIDLDERDPLFDQVARMLVLEQQGSVSFIQRKFSIGYNRAGRLMDQLEAAGIVSAPDGSKGREVLIKSEEHLNEILMQF